MFFLIVPIVLVKGRKANLRSRRNAEHETQWQSMFNRKVRGQLALRTGQALVDVVPYNLKGGHATIIHQLEAVCYTII